MEIRVDGAKAESVPAECETALEAVAALNERLRSEGRAIIEISVDGTNVRYQDLVSRLSAEANSAGAAIDLRTRAIRELVDEAVQDLEKSLPELPTACHQLAVVFQGENPAEGYQPFEQLAAIWEHIKERELQIASALGVEIGSYALQGKTLETHHQELNGYLLEAVEAMRGQDTVLLGDLLEYELAPRASLEAEIVALLKDEAAKSFA